MALKGTLKDFSVADIFQLIGQQTKSGSLYVRTKEKEAHIVFDKGKVVLGTFRKSDEDFLLGTMLLRAGVISADQLSEAINNQKITLRSLGDILRTMGAITNEVLGEFVSLQLREVLFRVFQWKSGLYEFVAEDIRYNKSIIRPQPAEAVLMDGFRMLDEWPGIEAKAGNLESVFRPLVDPGQIFESSDKGSEDKEIEIDSEIDDAFSFDDEPKTKKENKSALSETDRNILRLLDGYRSLQEIIYLSRLGTFEASKAVANLLDRSLVIRVDQVGQTRVSAKVEYQKPAGVKEWLQASYKSLLIMFGLLAALPFAAFRTASHWSLTSNSALSDSQSAELPPLSFEYVKELNERERALRLLELYRLENREYPISLKELRDPSLHTSWNFIEEDGKPLLTLKGEVK